MQGQKIKRKCVFLILLLGGLLGGTMCGSEVLRAADSTEEINTTEETKMIVTEKTNINSDTEKEISKKKNLIGTIQEKAAKRKEPEKTQIKKARNEQTILDISEGDIRITKDGAAGGGLAEQETSLNSAGYWIIGKTDKYNMIVEEDVTTDITLDSVEITTGTAKKNCIDVSHADVTITLIGENKLYCNAGTAADGESGGAALAKEGMDDHTLIIQCESAEKAAHRCNTSCGSLLAKGAPNLFHAGAIGSTISNLDNKKKCGFANFTIKGGNIEALAGLHTPGIGSACISQTRSGGYTKNIRITGGNVKAVGTSYGSGIGSGYANKVDGIYITGGVVEAQGGAYAPGIGASGCSGFESTQSGESMNIKISGGDTIVTAIGDETTKMPGIGSGRGESKVSNVTATPDEGYQGYIQDGISLTDYAFMDGTPIHSETNIKVGQFYTKVYFGPYRDINEIEQDTKEQIGANCVISKSGGEPFTEEQLKALTKVTGKTKDGTDFGDSQLTLVDKKQLEVINEAKIAGKIGEFPLSYQTPNRTTATISVYLRNDGTDAVKFDPQNPSCSLGANNFTKETGGDPFTEENIKSFGELKGKNEDGVNIDLKDFTVNPGHMKQINDAKVAGKAGTFDLTYTAPSGKAVTVTVTLTGEYDMIISNAENAEMIKAMHIIGKTGGKELSEEQVKFISKVRAFVVDGDEIPTDQISVKMDSRLETINKMKKAGKTGSYPLTFQTLSGTEVTVNVYLTDEGTDGADIVLTEGLPTIGANNGKKETGGKGFTQEEIIALCSAKGKTKNGDSEKIQADENKLKVINAAKEAGKTGTFDLIFATESGTKVSIKVTLTGTHKVIFDSDNGSYTPKNQFINGGECIKEPDQPQKEGYTFEGWYYIDENAEERKWSFDAPLHQGIELTAKWKKNSEPSKSTQEEMDTNKKVPALDKNEKEEELPEWGQYQIKGNGSKNGTQNGTQNRTQNRTQNGTQNGEVSETSDIKVPLVVLILLITSGSISAGLLFRNYNRRK